MWWSQSALACALLYHTQWPCLMTVLFKTVSVQGSPPEVYFKICNYWDVRQFYLFLIIIMFQSTIWIFLQAPTCPPTALILYLLGWWPCLTFSLFSSSYHICVGSNLCSEHLFIIYLVALCSNSILKVIIVMSENT